MRSRNFCGHLVEVQLANQILMGMTCLGTPDSRRVEVSPLGGTEADAHTQLHLLPHDPELAVMPAAEGAQVKVRRALGRFSPARSALSDIVQDLPRRRGACSLAPLPPAFSSLSLEGGLHRHCSPVGSSAVPGMLRRMGSAS